VALVAALAAGSFALAFAVRNEGAAAKAKRMKNPVPPVPAALAAGKQSYGDHCEKCHGANGNGRGEKAAELTVAPSDFTNVQEMGRLADGELFEEITKGDLPMPAFEDKLGDEARWQLVDYIRTFASGIAAAP